jgi:hypothetical protein
MINIDLNNIKKWGDTWLVKFNPNKTEIMIFNIRNQFKLPQDIKLL